MFVLLALCVCITAVAALLDIKVEPKSHGFIDSKKRQHVFHGVNVVYKLPPYVPITSGFDKDNSFSAVDIARLKQWGFNIVRLGVMWPGVEPTKGQYNSTYISEIETIVSMLEENEIYVILDFHQDLWHRQFCGEGVPDYVYDLCVKNEPKLTKSFPAPVVNETYPLDEAGYPKIESCLSKMFASYYLTSEVGAAFQCLYDNTENLWENFGNYWLQVVGAFKGHVNVLGYELINEPWLGNIYREPKNFLPKHTESKYLQPLYQYLHDIIRTVDDEKIIFYEGVTIDYWQSGFTQGPGDDKYSDRQAYAYHIYCPISNATMKLEFACDLINDEFFYMRMKDVERLNSGMIMTEFGAAEDTKGDIYAVKKMMDLTEKHVQSWIYWQYKYFQDITTCTPEGEGFYDEDGELYEDKVKVLSRAYPQIIAGAIDNYNFADVTRKLTLEYVLVDTSDSNVTHDTESLTSVIYVNKQYDFKVGAKVTINSNQDKVTVSCDNYTTNGLIQIIQKSDIPVLASTLLSLEIEPCLFAEACTCK